MNLFGLSIGLMVVLTAPRAARAGKHCWPGHNVTKSCFASVPPSVIPWPTTKEDSYNSNDEEVVDFDSFSVSRVQKSPRDFCLYKDELVSAMDCMSQEMAALCPELPDEMLSKSHRLQLAMNGFCSQIDNTDPVCLKDHWELTMKCHDSLMKQKKGESGMSRPEGDSGRPKWGDRPEHDGDAEKPMLDRKTWNQIICRFKYQMKKCVMESTRDCHQKTAEVMAQFMQDMSTESCATLMDSWAATEQDAGASSVSVAWATALSSAFLLVLCRVGFG